MTEDEHALIVRLSAAADHCDASAARALERGDHRMGAWWSGRAADLLRSVREVERELATIRPPLLEVIDDVRRELRESGHAFDGAAARRELAEDDES